MTSFCRRSMIVAAGVAAMAAMASEGSEVIVIATSQLTGSAQGDNWYAEWSYTIEDGPLDGWIKVESDEHAEVYFTLDAPGPWIHEQWVQGEFSWLLLLPEGGGQVDHIDDEPVWVFNGNSWLVPPMSLGSSGAGVLRFTWSPPVDVSARGYAPY